MDIHAVILPHPDERTLITESAHRRLDGEKLNLMTHSDQPDAAEVPEADAAPGPRRRLPGGRRSRPFNVRARILAAVVGLAGLALAVSGYTAFAIQQAQVE